MLDAYIESLLQPRLPHAEVTKENNTQQREEEIDTQRLWNEEKSIKEMLNFVAFSRGLAIAEKLCKQVCTAFAVTGYTFSLTDNNLVYECNFDSDIEGVSQFMCDWVRQYGEVPPLPHSLIKQKIEGLFKWIR